MRKFIKDNKEVLQNPIVKSFLAIKSNYELVQKAVLFPSEKNKSEVDVVFKSYYTKLKLIKYVSKLIYFYSIDYDKRINKLNSRYFLTLGQPLLSEGDNCISQVKSEPFRNLILSHFSCVCF